MFRLHQVNEQGKLLSFSKCNYSKRCWYPVVISPLHIHLLFFAHFIHYTTLMCFTWMCSTQVLWLCTCQKEISRCLNAGQQWYRASCCLCNSHTCAHKSFTMTLNCSLSGEYVTYVCWKTKWTVCCSAGSLLWWESDSQPSRKLEKTGHSLSYSCCCNDATRLHFSCKSWIYNNRLI